MIGENGKNTKKFIDYIPRISDQTKIVSYDMSLKSSICNLSDDLTLFQNWADECRLLKEMATTILVKYNGNIPSERKDLLGILEIGDYITDAMIVFAFNGERINYLLSA
jgi:endonuclease III